MPTCRRMTLSALVRSWASEFEELFEQEESSAMDEVVIDEDGELIFPRRKTSRRCFGVKIQHNITSPIPNVGLQVSEAELVPADFILHKICDSSDFAGVVALELGAGTGAEILVFAKKIDAPSCGANSAANSLLPPSCWTAAACEFRAQLIKGSKMRFKASNHCK